MQAPTIEELEVKVAFIMHPNKTCGWLTNGEENTEAFFAQEDALWDLGWKWQNKEPGWNMSTQTYFQVKEQVESSDLPERLTLPAEILRALSKLFRS
jgi:hypothetical protein